MYLNRSKIFTTLGVWASEAHLTGRVITCNIQTHYVWLYSRNMNGNERNINAFSFKVSWLSSSIILRIGKVSNIITDPKHIIFNNNIILYDTYIFLTIFFSTWCAKIPKPWRVIVLCAIWTCYCAYTRTIIHCNVVKLWDLGSSTGK